jgi:hypothetical protein
MKTARPFGVRARFADLADVTRASASAPSRRWPRTDSIAIRYGVKSASMRTLRAVVRLVVVGVSVAWIEGCGGGSAGGGTGGTPAGTGGTLDGTGGSPGSGGQADTNDAGGGSEPDGFAVGGATMCGEVEPCGGDLTGSWVFTNACYTSTGIKDGEAASCAGITLSVTALYASGTLAFASDMTYTATALMNGGTLVYSDPESCHNGLSCSQLATDIQTSGGVQSAYCTGSGTCSCTVVKGQTFSESGTYTTSGSTFSVTPTGGGTSRITGSAGSGSYCVQGATLHLLSTSTMSMGTTGQVGIDQDTIGTKQ